jgi:hypothetical protein
VLAHVRPPQARHLLSLAAALPLIARSAVSEGPDAPAPGPSGAKPSGACRNKRATSLRPGFLRSSVLTPQMLCCTV